MLKQAIEDSTVRIVSNDADLAQWLQVRMLGKRFFQDVYKYLYNVQINTMRADESLKITDYPPYFQPIKSAYEATCMVQNPQRLPDFDTLFQATTAPVLPFQISPPDVNGVLRVEVVGYSSTALQQWNEGTETAEREWVTISEAAIRLGYETSTLESWRGKGTKPNENENGIDSKGNTWRYTSPAKNKTEYLLPLIDPR